MAAINRTFLHLQMSHLLKCKAEVASPLDHTCHAHLQVYVNGISLQGTAEAAQTISAECLQTLDGSQVHKASSQ